MFVGLVGHILLGHPTSQQFNKRERGHVHEPKSTSNRSLGHDRARQVWQARTALQPTPQETHFRVVQEFRKEKAKDNIEPTEAYVACMSGLNR